MLWLKLNHVSERGPWEVDIKYMYRHHGTAEYVYCAKVIINNILLLSFCWFRTNCLHVLRSDTTRMLQVKDSSNQYFEVHSHITSYLICIQLTHWDQVTHVCVNKQWLIAWPASSHYLNKCQNVVNWNLGTNFNEFLIEIYIFSFSSDV